jgi:hypothetical protein
VRRVVIKSLHSGTIRKCVKDYVRTTSQLRMEIHSVL